MNPVKKKTGDLIAGRIPLARNNGGMGERGNGRLAPANVGTAKRENGEFAPILPFVTSPIRSGHQVRMGSHEPGYLPDFPLRDELDPPPREDEPELREDEPELREDDPKLRLPDEREPLLKDRELP